MSICRYYTSMMTGVATRLQLRNRVVYLSASSKEAFVNHNVPSVAGMKPDDYRQAGSTFPSHASCL